MSMNTYPFEQKCALVVTPAVACAMLLKDSIDNGVETDFIPDEIKAAIEAGRRFLEIAEDPGFTDALDNNGWRSVSDAYDMLETYDVDGMVHCSEFDGSAEISEGFGDEKSQSISFEDDFVLFLTPMRGPSLFSQAYASRDELVQEYKDRLAQFLDDDFPYARYIMDVSGTYFC